MKTIPGNRWLALVATACGGAWALDDMAGRRLPIPAPVGSVYSTSPVGEIFLYTLAPDKVKGVCWTLRTREKPWLLPAYAGLPVLGGWFGKSGSANLEEIVRVKPDVIVSAGLADSQAVAFADRVQGQTTIPVFVVAGALRSTDSAYRVLGRLVGREARADTLARIARRILTETVQRRNARSGTKAPTVYYAEGLLGLETDPAGSQHTEPFDWVGARNVAHVPMERGFGRARVSMEQLLAWDPDWILVGEDHTDDGGESTWERLRRDPNWKLLRAVREGRMVRIPDLPFNWIDRPPGPARLLGLLWLEAVLFPKQSPRATFEREMREFFRQFYHRRLSPAEEAEVLRGAWPGTR